MNWLKIISIVLDLYSHTKQNEIEDSQLSFENYQPSYYSGERYGYE